MFQKLRENRGPVLFVLAFWLADVAFTFQHEAAHRAICENYGGNVTYINYSFGWASAETYCSVRGKGLELQMWTDIVGYHAAALIYAFFFGILLLVAYDQLK